jgi:hypothetical protein
MFWKTTNFYFYFVDESQTQPLIKYLKSKGFKIVSRASDDQWLVLASRFLTSLEIMFLDNNLEEIAVKYGAEYDGYERNV